MDGISAVRQDLRSLQPRDYANTNSPDLIDVHGFQNSNLPTYELGQTGTMIVEYYGNTFVNTTGYRWFAHRGSWGLYHNNILTGANSGTIAMMQYGYICYDPHANPPINVCPYGGGCTSQWPSIQAAGLHTEVANTYVFNNTAGGTIKNMWPWFTDGCGVSGENVGFWNYNPSFGSGTGGIGEGTSTPTVAAANGAGYWKCSTPTPTTNPAVVQTGHFYKRVAGTWVDYYTPYTYPHPLAEGSVPESTPTPTPGPSATPTPTATPAPTATPVPLGTVFTSPEGVITNPFVVSNNTVFQTIETLDPNAGGRAVCTFTVPTSGDYALSAQVQCPNDYSNSFFVNIDAEPSSTMVWAIPVTSGTEVRTATWGSDTATKVWTLQAGTHQLIIRGREANAVLVQIALSIPPSPPQGVQIVQ